MRQFLAGGLELFGYLDFTNDGLAGGRCRLDALCVLIAFGRSLFEPRSTADLKAKLSSGPRSTQCPQRPPMSVRRDTVVMLR